IVTWAFVVEREAFACETYAVSPFVEAAPLDGRDGGRGTLCPVTFWRWAKRWPQRIRPQPVLDVGNDQLLVLLLVVDSERHQRHQLGRRLGCEHMHDRVIHVC